MGTVEDSVLLGHPAGVPAVAPLSDQIVVPAEALPLVLAGVPSEFGKNRTLRP